MSEEECLHISVAGQRRIGFLSGTRKVGKTEYSGHGTNSFKEWRDGSNGVGFAYDLERAWVTVEDEYNSIIEMYFPPTFNSSSLRFIQFWHSPCPFSRSSSSGLMRPIVLSRSTILRRTNLGGSSPRFGRKSLKISWARQELSLPAEV